MHSSLNNKQTKQQQKIAKNLQKEHSKSINRARLNNIYSSYVYMIYYFQGTGNTDTSKLDLSTYSA